MDRESLYGSRVRYEAHLCDLTHAPDGLPTSVQPTEQGWWHMPWLRKVSHLVSSRATPLVDNDIPVQESAYSTWLCLRPRGERL
jgi:hypothetical protein